MTATTIKVSMTTRDRLKDQARAAGKTLGDYLAELADAADKRNRFARLKGQIADTPTELMASYDDETSAWDGIDGGR